MGEHYIRGNKEMHFVYKEVTGGFVEKKEATIINVHLFKK